MFYEYAVEPALWGNWEDFRYFAEKFGWDQGRLISRYPKKWKRLVYEALTQCGEVERKRIEERLANIDEKLLTRPGAGYQPADEWLTNAVNEHGRNPFRAVLARDNPGSHPDVFVGDLIDEGSEPRWNVPKDVRAERTVSAISSAVERLLEAGNEILFIDKMFEPGSERWRRVLAALLAIVDRAGNPPKRVEYHLKVGRDDLPQEAEERTRLFQALCDQHLAPVIPQGLTLTLFRWLDQHAGDDLHARYILTEVGGVRLDWGLDAGKPGQTTDISILGASLRKSRWDDVQPDSTPFTLIDSVSVTGTAN